MMLKSITRKSFCVSMALNPFCLNGTKNKEKTTCVYLFPVDKEQSERNNERISLQKMEEKKK